MPSTHRIPHLAIAITLALTLLAASTPARAQQTDPAVTVPVSEHNARWPREPASGPLPPTTAPAPTPAQPRNHTTIPVLAGLLLLAACTATATGLRVRPRPRRRITA